MVRAESATFFPFALRPSPFSMTILHSLLVSVWQSRGPVAWLLLPLSLLFFLLSSLRRVFFRLGWRESVRLSRPVVVVGNVTVGGAGKTPLTLWLAEELIRRGRRPGIVSRGYGGAASSRGEVRAVRAEDVPDEVGDEPLLMARRRLCPVWIGRDRAAAGAALIVAHPECDVILCDDGLQHYRLARDVEIVVMDGRGAGNGFLLPAGPLREPLARIRRAHALVLNGGGAPPLTGLPTFAMRLVGERFSRLPDTGETAPASAFFGRRQHALAGIGNPRRFFEHLSALGLNPACHPFPDHHRFVAGDISNFDGDEVLFMTEKDGVKCAALAAAGPSPEIRVLRVQAEVDPALVQIVLEKLNGSPSA